MKKEQVLCTYSYQPRGISTRDSTKQKIMENDIRRVKEMQGKLVHGFRITSVRVDTPLFGHGFPEIYVAGFRQEKS